jgi:uncharacterized linocin/CFP29 family protein
MDRNSAEVGWSDEQWSRVNSTVAEQARVTRVAASFLPMCGPLEPDTVAIPDFGVSSQAVPGAIPAPGVPPRRVAVDSDPTLMLTTLSSLVYLRSHEVADPDLSAALGAFRRAASLVSRMEDALVFLGRPGANAAPVGLFGAAAVIPQVAVTGGGFNDGLLPFNPPQVLPFPQPPAPVGPLLGLAPRGAFQIGLPTDQNIVLAVVSAITALEQAGHFAPFACVLSSDLYQAICSPTGNLVLPRDRILPFVDGQLYRSGIIPAGYGLVVAAEGGAALELVVASDLSVRFLQVNPEPRWVFRVSERIALRTRQLDSVVVLHR